jgi:hypothetical protein
LVEFPFTVGSTFSLVSSGDLVLKRVRAPQAVGIFLDIKDPAFLETLKPSLATIPSAASGHLVAPLHPMGPAATLLQPTSVGIPLPTPWRQTDDDSLLLHLPANTRVEVRGSQVERLLAPVGRPFVSGFELVTLQDKSLLSLSSVKQGRMRLPLKAGETKQMVLKVAIPKTAAVGDKYEFQAVQYDKVGRPVGGVVLEINIVA